MRNVGWIGTLLILAAILLVACGSDATPVVVQEGAAQTAAAATAFYVEATAAVEAEMTRAVLPTASPTVASTPYVRPTDDPEIDLDRVIASVAGHDITVAEFRNRVRYQRWVVLTTLQRVADLSDMEAIDIRDPENTMAPTMIGYLYTLADVEEFAGSMLEFMIQERIIHQEFIDREMEPPAEMINNLWARLVGLDPTANGVLPEYFDDAFDAFMIALGQYTDLSEIELRFLIAAQAEEEFVALEVGVEVEIDVEEINIRLILVETEEEALEIVALLEDGADFNELARERSLAENARGNGGYLGYVEPGVTVPEFEEAAFAAELNIVTGPVQTQFGYHLILVGDRDEERRSRNILVETEAEAEAVLERLNDGEDFADLVAELSLDPDGAASGGYLDFVGRGDTPEAYDEALFSGEVGDVIGPVQTDFGYHVIEITDRRVIGVDASHILVETEEEALSALEELENGADFTTLANEISLDTGGPGAGGELGFLSASKVPAELFNALRVAADFEIVGPLETELGFVVAQTTERRIDMLTPEQLDERQGLHFQNWLRAQIDEVEVDEIWREVYPADPQPGDVAPYLAELEDAMNEALASYTPVPEATDPQAGP